METITITPDGMTMQPIATKRCSKCGKELPLTAFYKVKNALMSNCKECHKEANRVLYAQKKNLASPPPYHPEIRTLNL